MEQAEPITDYLKRRLREAGASKFDEIAEKAGVTVSFIRKFVYGSRENPRVQTIQPLMDYFQDTDGRARVEMKRKDKASSAPDLASPTANGKPRKPAKQRKPPNADRSNGHNEHKGS